MTGQHQHALAARMRPTQHLFVLDPHQLARCAIGSSEPEKLHDQPPDVRMVRPARRVISCLRFLAKYAPQIFRTTCGDRAAGDKAAGPTAAPRVHLASATRRAQPIV
jgi:hypothetical protein